MDMLGRILRLLIIALLGSSALAGCSSMSKSGRQQAAYARYVKKFSHNRVKQKTKFKAVKVPKAPKSQNVVSSGAGNSPQAVSSSPTQASQ